jgi:hypothetical protein
MNNDLESMSKSLEDILSKLKEISEATGAAERARMIRQQIKDVGWDKVSLLIHPDNNRRDPAAKELYAFYVFIYEDMKRKGETV